MHECQQVKRTTNALFLKHRWKKYSDFVGPDSWTFFSLFQIEINLLDLPVAK